MTDFILTPKATHRAKDTDMEGKKKTEKKEHDSDELKYHNKSLV